MNKKMILTYKEQWILWYGGYNELANLIYEPKEFDIDIDKAIKAEQKAYEELCENNSLLRSAGYRERRLDLKSHYSLRDKLRNNE